ncbi:endo alpha-1,4 polygalactosaminidase [Ectobacillus panaciterrae]|uniref:endo alpha-1,4 polygalactosaminidase n=1 Tax=Ectobacillus panaciterrae TaxID=363872 RepID=UPI00040C71DC|nr:endo alpha-1,4 polygalactosaminidase [Ectobacillus panaciterrae]
MKAARFIACLMFAFAAFLPNGARAMETGNMPNVLNSMKSYKIFYNAPNSQIISQLGTYDFVMIEPYHYTAEQIQKIKASGTRVFGYISTMEAANWNQQLMAQFEPQDYFYRDGEKVHFAQWDSYLMDIASPHYQQILMSEIEKNIAAKGFDGIFLDTVGDIDNEHSGTVLQTQREGMKMFLKGIKETYPGMALIQNWGFETLKTTTAPYVNAIMWEDFNYSTVAKDQWSLDRIQDLQTLHSQYNIEVLTVSCAEKTKSTQLAQKYGFIHYHTNRGYDIW